MKLSGRGGAREGGQGGKCQSEDRTGDTDLNWAGE